MKLALHILGTEVVAIVWDESKDDAPGDFTSNQTSVGFIADDLAIEHRKGN